MSVTPMSPHETFRAAVRELISNLSVPFGPRVHEEVEIFVPPMDRTTIVALHNVAAGAAGRGDVKTTYQSQFDDAGILVGYATKLAGGVPLVRQLLEEWQSIALEAVIKQCWSVSDVEIAAGFGLDLSRTHSRELGT